MIPYDTEFELATIRRRDLLVSAERERGAAQVNPARTAAPAAVPTRQRLPASARLAALLTGLASAAIAHDPRTTRKKPARPGVRPQAMASGVAGG